MLTDAGRAQIEEAERRRHAFIRGEGPMIDPRFGARSLGDLNLVEVGCRLWGRETFDSGDVTDMRMDSHGNARGGVVVEITDSATVDEDGEITRHRAFRCFDPASPTVAGAFVTLTEKQVNPERCEPSSPFDTAKVLRRMAQEVSRGSGPLSAYHGQILGDMLRLAGTLLQRRVS